MRPKRWRRQKMENERAIEILDPEHREAYESLEPVNEACRMGVEALRRRVPESPYPDGGTWWYWPAVLRERRIPAQRGTGTAAASAGNADRRLTGTRRQSDELHWGGTASCAAMWSIIPTAAWWSCRRTRCPSPTRWIAGWWRPCADMALFELKQEYSGAEGLPSAHF